MFKDTTTAADLRNGEMGQVKLIRANVGKMTKPTPTPAGWMRDNRSSAQISACIACQVEDVAAGNRLVDAVLPGEEDGNHDQAARATAAGNLAPVIMASSPNEDTRLPTSSSSAQGN